MAWTDSKYQCPECVLRKKSDQLLKIVEQLQLCVPNQPSRYLPVQRSEFLLDVVVCDCRSDKFMVFAEPVTEDIAPVSTSLP